MKGREMQEHDEQGGKEGCRSSESTVESGQSQCNEERLQTKIHSSSNAANLVEEWHGVGCWTVIERNYDIGLQRSHTQVEEDGDAKSGHNPTGMDESFLMASKRHENARSTHLRSQRYEGRRVKEREIKGGEMRQGDSSVVGWARM